MYKLLIVDDEDIEREGMANFIPWHEYGIELIGTAWNGVEGYEKIQRYEPDIVITDIKMPVIDGIELVRKTKERFPDIVFAVLSGYGEYEYTSRMMEMGIKHYLLKPCNEEKIIKVMETIQQQLSEEKEKQREEKAYRNKFQHLAPRALEQMFRNVLLNRELLQENLEEYLKQRNIVSTVFLLFFRKSTRFDYLEEFVLKNILSELLGEQNLFLVTSIEYDVIFLLDSALYNDISLVTVKLEKEYKKFDTSLLEVVSSKTGAWQDMNCLYQEVRASEKKSSMQITYTTNEALINIENIQNAKTYETVLFEVYLTLKKLKLGKEYDKSLELNTSELLYALYQKDAKADFNLKKYDEVQNLIDYICHMQNIQKPQGREGLRMQEMLHHIYQNIHQQELSMQWLAKEVLFMNEDYLSRLFCKCMNQKYSSYITFIRIEMSKHILKFLPDIKIFQLAIETGYPADGQYFSKTFRKITGMTPSEYREHICRKN